MSLSEVQVVMDKICFCLKSLGVRWRYLISCFKPFLNVSLQAAMIISLYAILKSKLSYSVMFGCFFTSSLNVLKMPASSIPMGYFPVESQNVAGISKRILFKPTPSSV